MQKQNLVMRGSTEDSLLANPLILHSGNFPERQTRAKEFPIQYLSKFEAEYRNSGRKVAAAYSFLYRKCGVMNLILKCTERFHESHDAKETSFYVCLFRLEKDIKNNAFSFDKLREHSVLSLSLTI
jgi:hypothetical protein